MPNTNAPFGFQEAAGLGSPPTFEQIEEKIAATTAPIFRGDPVFRLADGTIAGATTGPGPGTGVLAGIFAGLRVPLRLAGPDDLVELLAGGRRRRRHPEPLLDHQRPGSRFRVQAGNSTTVGFVQADVGMNASSATASATPPAASRARTSTWPSPEPSPRPCPSGSSRLVVDPPGGPGTQPGPYNWAIVGFNNVETKSLMAQA